MADLKELAREWLAAFPEGRFDEFSGQIAEDLIFRLPFPPPGAPTEFRGRDNILAVIMASVAGRSAIAFSDEQIYLTDDPEVVFATANGRATMANGNIYENSYVFVTRIRDGVVIEHSEYLNPLKVIAAAQDPGSAS